MGGSNGPSEGEHTDLIEGCARCWEGQKLTQGGMEGK